MILRRTNKSIRKEPGQHWIGHLLGRLNWKSTKCLFIIGTGRVGSTTTIELLNLSPRIAAFHEPKPLLLEESKAAYHDLKVNEEKYRRAFTKARCGPIGAVGRSKRIYAHFGATPSLATMIADLLDHSYFLHLYRHPGPSVRSHMRRLQCAQDSWGRYWPEPAADDPVRKDWDETWDTFSKCVWLWSFINQRILEAQEVIPSERFISIPSEELLDYRTGAYKKLFSFLGIDAPRGDAVQQVLAIKLNAQTEGEFPVYSEWTSRQREILREISRPIMDILGYEERI